jgi:hypothetical protein
MAMEESQDEEESRMQQDWKGNSIGWPQSTTPGIRAQTHERNAARYIAQSHYTAK